MIFFVVAVMLVSAVAGAAYLPWEATVLLAVPAIAAALAMTAELVGLLMPRRNVVSPDPTEESVEAPTETIKTTAVTEIIDNNNDSDAGVISLDERRNRKETA